MNFRFLYITKKQALNAIHFGFFTQKLLNINWEYYFSFN